MAESILLPGPSAGTQGASFSLPPSLPPRRGQWFAPVHPELDAKLLLGGFWPRCARPEVSAHIPAVGPSSGGCLISQPGSRSLREASDAGSAVAEPEMDGVGSNRTMSYSRWSYNRYGLSCFGLPFFLLFFLPDVVKLASCLYKLRLRALFRKAETYTGVAFTV